jgi:hypothetical protein
MGSATIVVDILSPGPTAQLAARLLDVDPATSNETLVARGLYRPEINTAASCQVFQLHPAGWKFAEGHIVKLELLPADQPYGRNSNGQTPITVANLRLRLPVLEAPNGGVVQARSGKVLPAGYELAPDVTVGIDDTCAQAEPTTTTTVTSTTEDTTTTTLETNTTTTTLPSFSMTVRRVKVRAEKKQGAANGRVDVQGEISGIPAFSTPPPFTVRVEDSDHLDVSHSFQGCTTKTNGKVSCRETEGGDWRATFTPKGGNVSFKISMRGQAVTAPFAGPVTTTLLHNSAVVRIDTTGGCSASDSGLKCQE